MMTVPPGQAGGRGGKGGVGGGGVQNGDRRAEGREMEGLTMAQFTRRHVLAGAAGLALIGTNRAKAEDLPPHEKELYESAKREGELTWYSGQLSAETSEAVGR